MGSHQKTEMPTDTHLLESKMGVRNDEGKTEIFYILLDVYTMILLYLLYTFS